WQKLTQWLAKAKKGQFWDTVQGWKPFQKPSVTVNTIKTPSSSSTSSSGSSSTSLCVATIGTNEQKALLDTIAWSEGTRNKYNIMYGGKEFTSYDDHPAATGEMPAGGITAGGFTSTAAGRYQFLHSTYDALKSEGYFSNGFNSAEQDKAALEGLIVKKRRMSQELLKSSVDNGNFDQIWGGELAKEWASFPSIEKSGSSYYSGQRAQKSSDLKNVFLSCLQFYNSGGKGSAAVGAATLSPVETKQGATVFIKDNILQQACTAASLECVIPPQNVGKVEAPGIGNCPAGMVLAGKICIDQYEAMLVNKNNGEVWSPYCSPGNDISNLRAASIAGAVPQSTISQLQAKQACENSGKRLCAASEWLSTCQGTDGNKYPYGTTLQNGACNDQFISKPYEHPVKQMLDASCKSWNTVKPGVYTNTPWMIHPQVNQLSTTLAAAGSYGQCKTPEGAYDLVGNLDEWVDETANCNAGTCGVFRGGFYARSERADGSSGGCTYRTAAHASSYSDYSLGFRCCADPTS
ncbi:MAG: SUMF1/EgtB/PvdO family nonheme iron enzyme, partial [Nanoarchaeota archaeon]